MIQDIRARVPALRLVEAPGRRPPRARLVCAWTRCAVTGALVCAWRTEGPGLALVEATFAEREQPPSRLARAA